MTIPRMPQHALPPPPFFLMGPFVIYLQPHRGPTIIRGTRPSHRSAAAFRSHVRHPHPTAATSNLPPSGLLTRGAAAANLAAGAGARPSAAWSPLRSWRAGLGSRRTPPAPRRRRLGRQPGWRGRRSARSLKSTGLTQNLGRLFKALIGIFSQTAGSTCKFGSTL